jgi:hypothetical protein
MVTPLVCVGIGIGTDTVIKCFRYRTVTASSSGLRRLDFQKGFPYGLRWSYIPSIGWLRAHERLVGSRLQQGEGNVLRYVIAWFPMLIIAVVNGALRQVTFAKTMPELRAHQLSTLIGALVIVPSFGSSFAGGRPRRVAKH